MEAWTASLAMVPLRFGGLWSVHLGSFLVTGNQGEAVNFQGNLKGTFKKIPKNSVISGKSSW